MKASSADQALRPRDGRLLQRGHVAAIDGLRAVAVLAVLLYHLDEAALPGGFVGVDVFFVISGFVVTRSLLAGPPVRPGLRGLAAFAARFYRRRALRILPALFACLLVLALLSMLLIPSGGLSRRNDITGLAAAFGAGNLALWQGADDYFAPVPIYNPFTHTWSLGVEEQFYLVFPLLFFLLAARPVRGLGGGQIGDGQGRGRPLALPVLGGLCALSLAGCAVASLRAPQFAFYMLPVRFWELGLGALVALVLAAPPPVFRPPFRPPVFWGPTVAAAAPALALLALLGLGIGLVAADAERFPYPWALLPAAAAAVLCGLAVLAPEAGANRLLASPPLVFLGRVSYGLYLWHFGVIVLFRWTLGMTAPAVQVAAGLLTLGLAIASYHLLEQPLRTSPRLARLADRTILAGAAASLAVTVVVMGGIFLARPVLSLSVTRDPALWSMRPPTRVEVAGCRVERREEQMRGGVRIRFEPAGCTTPAGAVPVAAAAPAGPEIGVIGDSHAGAYQTLFQEIAGRARVPVTIFQAFGCPVLRFWDAPGRRSPACRAFLERASVELSGRLKAGDVLFLPALRMPRFRDQWDAGVVENAALILKPTPADAASAMRGAVELAPFLGRGIAVVVEAPKPLFRAAPFRCADPFTAGNPYCAPGLSVERAEMEARRVRAMAGIAIVAELGPEVSVWDPLPRLCPGAVCDAFRAGDPLYVDGDHLGPAGNRLLLPDFAAHLADLPGTLWEYRFKSDI